MNFHDFMCEIEESDDKKERLQAILKLCNVIAKGGAYNLDRLLSCLFRSSDCYFNSRLFLLLAYIASQNRYHKLKLIRNKQVYEIAFQSLANNSLAKIIGVIRYFTSLLKSELETDTNMKLDHRHLAIAQNSIRVTGCLTQLCQFFLNDAVSADMWRPLCLCLAECCRGSSLNQAQGSQLLYKCVEHLTRPKPDRELLTLIQSLVDSHSLNCKMFVQLGGMKCFTRDNLQMMEGLHLLCSVVEGYSAALTAACQQNIPEIVKEVSSVKTTEKKFLHWASLAMWHLHGKSDKPDDKHNSSNCHIISSRTKGLITNEMKLDQLKLQNLCKKNKNMSAISSSKDTTLQNDESIKKNSASASFRKYNKENYVKYNEKTKQTHIINGVINKSSEDIVKSGSDNKLSSKTCLGSVFDSSDEFDSFVGDDPPMHSAERSRKTTLNKLHGTLSNTESSGNNYEHDLQSHRVINTNDEAVYNYRNFNSAVSSGDDKFFHRFCDILQLQNSKVSEIPTENATVGDNFKHPRDGTYLSLKNNQLHIIPNRVATDMKSNIITPPVNKINCISGGFPGQNSSKSLNISIDDDFIPLCSSTPKKIIEKKSQITTPSLQENDPNNRVPTYNLPFVKPTAVQGKAVKRPHTVICRNQSIQTDNDDSSNFATLDASPISCYTHNRRMQNAMVQTPFVLYEHCTCFNNASCQQNSRDRNNNISMATVVELNGGQDTDGRVELESSKLPHTNGEPQEPPKKCSRIFNGKILDANSSTGKIIPTQNLRPKSTADTVNPYLGTSKSAVELNGSRATAEEVFQISVCKTCDDTISLKRKMKSNGYLRKTVKKLRIGITMYGCNFKKIADVLWPEDEYVTSNVLYGLYKKLILQK